MPKWLGRSHLESSASNCSSFFLLADHIFHESFCEAKKKHQKFCFKVKRGKKSQARLTGFMDVSHRFCGTKKKTDLVLLGSPSGGKFTVHVGKA